MLSPKDFQQKFLDSLLLNDHWKVFPHSVAERCIPNWKPYPYLVYISKKISRAVATGGGRLIIEIPPRHGKSTLISTAIPVWFLEWFPEKRVILTSYEADFAARWGRSVRNIFESHPSLQTKIARDSNAADRWDTLLGGGMVAVGAGGSITGRGADLIIIDDPIKNWQEACSQSKRRNIKDWFASTLYTRAEPNASIIVLQTRWHEDDLAGYLQNDHEDDWEVIRLPALAEENDLVGRAPGDALCPDRYSESDLSKIKAAIGSRMWSALYQQRPTAQEGGIIKRNWIHFWNEVNLSEMEEVSQYWDLAFKGDSTSDKVVGQVWGRKGSSRFLLDQVRGNWDAPQTIQMIMQLSQRWPKTSAKYIEDKANGPAIVAMMRDKVQGLIPVNPEGSKESRLFSISPFFEAGNVFIPDPTLYSWVSDYIEELVGFPNMTHDDQVDATSMALQRMSDMNQPKIWVL